MGQRHFVQGRYELAIEQFDLAIQVDSNYALGYYWRGASYLKLGQDQRAIEDYDHSIWLQATSFFYEQRGMAYYEMGPYSLAIQDLARTTILDPTTAESFHWKAHADYARSQQRYWSPPWSCAARGVVTSRMVASGSGRLASASKRSCVPSSVPISVAA